MGRATVIHNTIQNSCDNFPSYRADKHHSWDDVYWRGGGTAVAQGSAVLGQTFVLTSSPTQLQLSITVVVCEYNNATTQQQTSNCKQQHCYFTNMLSYVKMMDDVDFCLRPICSALWIFGHLVRNAAPMQSVVLGNWVSVSAPFAPPPLPLDTSSLSNTIQFTLGIKHEFSIMVSRSIHARKDVPCCCRLWTTQLVS